MPIPLPWLNPPPEWRAEGDTLTVRTGRETDFWNATFYGFARVEFRLPEGDWRLARLCHLDMDDVVMVGPMACSPQGEGLEVRFSGFEVAPPIPRELHG
ncbi:hypothetical protein VE25_08095 [Devosia geojensis]|uniref:DUF1349 domain-containing protein n=1 Tax=Devosia geojensis TaxID=443610 RepID=A0A0F5FVL5_9HYPH|nr:DUF1349 domain-containing protein [Devosia geojensis]KKB12217.1 hypothetical protein VE25_08095 [Devosia geojensis]